jgi:predicted nucleic acid-binding protein
MSKIFLDTNVLVYAFDHGNPTKRQAAINLLKSLEANDTQTVISTQVMQEFYNVLTRKLSIPPREALQQTKTLTAMEVISVTPEMVLLAASLNDSTSISLWDALIVIAAQFAGCDVLSSEDFQASHVFGSLKIVNPFSMN